MKQSTDEPQIYHQELSCMDGVQVDPIYQIDKIYIFSNENIASRFS